ncbi:g3237 [Coccomyxa viridis]|uniref:G3237 protein n=1 Tax=Coccomyxa viridis TaxID=1274662 RepID=A0ABP1FQS5_9CHLO
MSDRHIERVESTRGRRDTAKAEFIPQPSVRTPVIAFLPPPSIYDAAVRMGVEKANMPAWKTFYLGVLAGFYLSFGGVLAYSIGGEVPSIKQENPGAQKLLYGAFGLPFGLALIVICGGELFTANAAMLPAAIYEGKATWLQLLKNWVFSFFGNLAGSLFIVWVVDETYLFETGALAGVANAKAVAVAKTSAEFGTTVVRGLLCNWLVTLGVWQATGAQDIIGKVFGVFFPVLAFVAIGFDHVIANMFLIPFGMKVGAPVSVGKYIAHSMIPVFIGNTIAAMFFVAMSYAFMYGTLPQRLSAAFWSLKEGHGLPRFNSMNNKDPSLQRNDTPVIPEDRPAITGIPHNGMKKSSSINSMA